jgi:hypothetical protein
MQFNYAITQLRNGRAARTPSMNGFIKREDYENNPENASLFTPETEEVFDIVFVENPSLPGGPVEHRFLTRKVRMPDYSRRFVFDESSKTAMSIDACFLNLVFQDTWEVCDLSLLEDALERRDTGRW